MLGINVAGALYGSVLRGHPARSREAEALLIGKPPHRDRFGEAAQVAAMALDGPESDVHASAQYRKELRRARPSRSGAGRQPVFSQTGH
jgi:CO/xanthine dehydrogenase FAD-binding subunit